MKPFESTEMALGTTFMARTKWGHEWLFEVVTKGELRAHVRGYWHGIILRDCDITPGTVRLLTPPNSSVLRRTDPASVNHMRPGTTFEADTRYGTESELFFAAADGWLYNIMGVRTDPSVIDPSTIRDVQPRIDSSRKKMRTW